MTVQPWESASSATFVFQHNIGWVICLRRTVGSSTGFDLELWRVYFSLVLVALDSLQLSTQRHVINARRSPSRTKVSSLKKPLPITVDWGIDHRDGCGTVEMQTQACDPDFVWMSDIDESQLNEFIRYFYRIYYFFAYCIMFCKHLRYHLEAWMLPKRVWQHHTWGCGAWQSRAELGQNQTATVLVLLRVICPFICYLLLHVFLRPGPDKQIYVQHKAKVVGHPSWQTITLRIEPGNPWLRRQFVFYFERAAWMRQHYAVTQEPDTHLPDELTSFWKVRAQCWLFRIAWTHWAKSQGNCSRI